MASLPLAYCVAGMSLFLSWASLWAHRCRASLPTQASRSCSFDILRSFFCTNLYIN